MAGFETDQGEQSNVKKTCVKTITERKLRRLTLTGREFRVETRASQGCGSDGDVFTVQRPARLRPSGAQGWQGPVAEARPPGPVGLERVTHGARVPGGTGRCRPGRCFRGGEGLGEPRTPRELLFLGILLRPGQRPLHSVQGPRRGPDTALSLC